MLRIEDLDRPRVVRGARERIEEDLLWLGLGWDEPPIAQSERTAAYEGALARLEAQGLVYPCDCSRAEIARAASAPHEGEETVYPGLCRERDPARPMKRPPALRVRVPDQTIAYDDLIVGRVAQNLAREVGDFVVRRGDGVFAYQLAVVVDDGASAITHVVRGADLVASTPRQIWLAGALGLAPARYMHVPLVQSDEGGRLEKRKGRHVPGSAGAWLAPAIGTVRELRQRGVSAERIVGELAHGLGLAGTNAPASALDVVAGLGDAEPAWRKDAWRLPLTLGPPEP